MITSKGTTVIVDESMQPWVGPHWREDSLIHQRAWAAALANEKVGGWVGGIYQSI